MAYEFESDLRDTVECGMRWLADFNAIKTKLAPFDRSNNPRATDARINGSVLENYLLRCWDFFSSKLTWVSYFVSIEH